MLSVPLSMIQERAVTTPQLIRILAKTALITGVAGQDGAHLAELLLRKGYAVHGIKWRSSLFNTDRIAHLYQAPHVGDGRFVLHYGDFSDSCSLLHVIQKAQPDEIYNLDAQSYVKVSFEQSEHTGNVDGLGTLRLLEAVGSLVWRSGFGSSRHPLRNCTASSSKFPRPRRRRSAGGRHTRLPSSMPTESP